MNARRWGEGFLLGLCALWFGVLACRGLDYGLPRAGYAPLLFEPKDAPALLPLVAETRETDRRETEPYKTFGHERLEPPPGYLTRVVQERPMMLNGRVQYHSINKLKWIGAWLLSSQLPDEQVVLHAIAQMRPAHLDFNPRHFTYGGAYIYPVAAMIGLGTVVGLIDVTPARRFYLERPEQVRRMFLLGKALGVAAGVAVIILLYVVGRVLFDRTVGVCAAIVASGYPPYLIEVHHLKPFLWSGAWFLGAVAGLAMWHRRSRLRWLLVTGVAMGMTIGSALVTGPLLLVPLVSIGGGLVRGHRSSPQRRQVLRTLVILGLTILVTFVACNPYLITTWHMLWDTMRQIRADQEAYGRLQYFNVASHQEVFRHLGISLGWLGSVCAVIGLGWALVRRTMGDRWLIGSFLAVYLIAFKWVAFADPVHHLIPVVSVVLLLTVRWMADIARAPSVWVRGLGWMIVVGLTGQVGWLGWRYQALYAGTPPQVVAGQWINAHVPHGATIGSWIHADGVRYGFPLFRYLDYRLVHDPDPQVPRFYRQPPDYLIAAKRTDMSEPLLAHEALLRHYRLVARFEHPGISAFSDGRWRDLLHYLIEDVRIYQRVMPTSGLP